jgi:hypothetical protein
LPDSWPRDDVRAPSRTHPGPCLSVRASSRLLAALRATGILPASKNFDAPHAVGPRRRTAKQDRQGGRAGPGDETLTG